MPNIEHQSNENNLLFCLTELIENKTQLRDVEIYAHIYNLKIKQVENLINALNDK